MKRVIAVAAVLVLLASPAWADLTPGIGQSFIFRNTSFTALGTASLTPVPGGSPGGAFWVNLCSGAFTGSVYQDQKAPQSKVYTTFCVESEVEFDWRTPYVFSIDKKAYSGDLKGGDPISDITEYIYDKWLSGNKAGWSQSDISQAIWAAESEDGGAKNGVYRTAAAALGYNSKRPGNPTHDATHTYALNLWYNFTQDRNGVWRAQDRQTQLITIPIGDTTPPVPAPGAALLVGLGLTCVGWMKRRIA